jgi:hypothetical protein
VSKASPVDRPPPAAFTRVKFEQRVRAHLPGVVDRLVHIALEGEDKQAIAAAKEIFMRLWGAPKTEVQVSGADGGAVRHAVEVIFRRPDAG